MATKEIAVRSTTIRTKFLSLMWLIAIFILPIVGNAGAQGSCIPRPAGMVSWWPGEGDALDFFLHNDGTPQGDVVFLPGLVGQAFSLDGVSASIATSLVLPSVGTFECWVNLASLMPSSSILSIAGTFGTANGDDRLWIEMVGPAGGPGVQPNTFVVNTGLAAANDIAIPFTLSVGVWKHIAVTFDYISGVYHLYIDGTLQGSSTGQRTAPTQHLRIGGVSSDFGQTFFFPGMIDEVSIYNRFLSASEIQAIYNAGSAGKCKEKGEYLLKVISSSSKKGAGVVTSNDGLISCGDGGDDSTCKYDYVEVTTVVLEAIPNEGSVFAGWTPTSLGCGTEPTCEVTIDKSRTVKAKFRGPNKLKVKVASKKGGSGTVISNVPGLGGSIINCPSALCENYYSLQETVTLTAASQGASTFLGWKPSSLGCGINLTCTVPMGCTRNVRVVFGP